MRAHIEKGSRNANNNAKRSDLGPEASILKSTALFFCIQYQLSSMLM